MRTVILQFPYDLNRFLIKKKKQGQCGKIQYTICDFDLFFFLISVLEKKYPLHNLLKALRKSP